MSLLLESFSDSSWYEKNDNCGLSSLSSEFCLHQSLSIYPGQRGESQPKISRASYDYERAFTFDLSSSAGRALKSFHDILTQLVESPLNDAQLKKEVYDQFIGHVNQQFMETEAEINDLLLRIKSDVICEGLRIPVSRPSSSSFDRSFASSASKIQPDLATMSSDSSIINVEEMEEFIPLHCRNAKPPVSEQAHNKTKHVNFKEKLTVALQKSWHSLNSLRIKMRQTFQPYLDLHARKASEKYSNAIFQVRETVVSKKQLKCNNEEMEIKKLEYSKKSNKLIFSDAYEGKLYSVSYTAALGKSQIETLYTIATETTKLLSFVVLDKVGAFVLVDQSQLDGNQAKSGAPKTLQLVYTPLKPDDSSSQVVTTIECDDKAQTFKLLRKSDNEFYLAIKESCIVRQFRCLPTRNVEQLSYSISLSAPFVDIDYNDRIKFGAVTYKSTVSSCVILGKNLKPWSVAHKTRASSLFGKCLVSRHRLVLVEDDEYCMVRIFNFNGFELQNISPEHSTRWSEVTWLLNGRFFVACWTLVESNNRLSLMYRTTSDFSEPMAENLSDLFSLKMNLKRLCEYTKTVSSVPPNLPATAPSLSPDPVQCEYETLVTADKCNDDRYEFNPTHIRSVFGNESEVYFSDILNACVKKATRTSSKSGSFTRDIRKAQRGDSCKVMVFDGIHVKGRQLSGVCPLPIAKNVKQLVLIFDCVQLQVFDVEDSSVTCQMSFSNELSYRSCRAYPGFSGSRLIVPNSASGIVHELQYKPDSTGSDMFRVIKRHKFVNLAFYYAYFDQESRCFVGSLLSNDSNASVYVCVFREDVSIECSLTPPMIDDLKWTPLRCALSKRLCFVNNEDQYVYIYNLDNFSVRRTNSKVWFLTVSLNSTAAAAAAAADSDSKKIEFLCYGYNETSATCIHKLTFSMI